MKDFRGQEKWLIICLLLTVIGFVTGCILAYNVYSLLFNLFS
jgi:uncharacterized membrane protein YqaE (UPF0057 family)